MDLFIRISEQEYLQIPENIRSAHLTSKIYRQDIGDIDQLMQEKGFKETYERYRSARKELDDLTYLLREKRRCSTTRT